MREDHIAGESNAVNSRLYAHADIFRRAQTKTNEMKEDLAREIENEIREHEHENTSKRRERDEKLTPCKEEFQLYREDVAALTTIQTIRTTTKRKVR